MRPVSALLALALCTGLAAPTVAQDGSEGPIARAIQSKTVSLDFTDAPVIDVVTYLRDVSGVNLTLDPEVRAELLDEDSRITLQLQQVPVAAALDVLCEFFGLRHVIRSGVCLITRPDRAMGVAQLRTYDLRDLLLAPRDHEAQPRDLFAAYLAEEVQSFEREGSEVYAEELMELIMGSVMPDSWDLPGSSITQLGEALIIQAAPGVHREIDRLLAGLRMIGHTRVSVRARAVQVDAATARAVRAGCTELPALSAAAAKLLDDAVAAGTARVLHAATVTGYNTQRVTLRDGTQRRIATPSGPAPHSVVADGLTLDVRPVLIAGQGSVHLAVSAQVARRGRTRRSEESESLDVVTIQTATVGPLGRTLLCGSGHMGAVQPGGGPVAETLLLLTVTTPGETAPPARRDALPRTNPGAAGPGVMAKLDGRAVSLAFNDTPIETVLTYFRDVGGVNLVLDRSVWEQYGRGELRVTLEVNDIPGDDALRLILELTNLQLDERPGYGLITTRGGEERGATALAVYDVRDLVQPAADRAARGPDLTARPGGGREWPDRQGEEAEPITSDQIADLIRMTVEPESWDTPPNALEPKVGMIIARNRPAVLAGVDEVLRQLRTISAQPVLVEALHVVADERAWTEAGFGRVLTAAQVATAAERAATGSGWRIAAVARVAGLNAQSFAVHAGRQLVVRGTDTGTLVAADGVVIQIRPIMGADGQNVYCDVVTTLNRANAAGELAAGLEAAETRTSAKVPSGGAIVLGGFAADGGEGSLVLLRVTPGR